MKFIKVEAQSVSILWPLVKDLVQKPVDQNLGEFNIDDVYNWLVSGYMHLWIIGNEEEIEKCADELKFDISEFEIVNETNENK